MRAEQARRIATDFAKPPIVETMLATIASEAATGKFRHAFRNIPKRAKPFLEELGYEFDAIREVDENTIDLIVNWS